MVTKTTLSFALMLSVALSQAGGMEVPSLRSSKLAALRLIHENKSFRVMDNDGTQEVPACWVDKEVRSVSTERLAKMLGHGYLSVNKMCNGEFSVKASVRGEGGLLITATVFYWGAKVVCYGPIIAGTVLSGVGFPIGAAIIAEITPAVEAIALGAAVVGLALPTP